MPHTPLRKPIKSGARLSDPSEAPLDLVAREAIELFALLLARCNFSREAAGEEFKRCLLLLPEEIGHPPAAESEPAQDDHYVPAEVLTQWHLLPQCVAGDGQPRALRAKGPGLTVASIVRRVQRRANPDHVLEYLLRVRAVRAVGSRFIPRERIVRHRVSSRQQRRDNLLSALALLRTVERNVRQDGQGRWYQYTTDANIPESQCVVFAQEMREVSDQTLQTADEAMFRRRLTRMRGERNLPMTVGVFMSEGQPLPSLISSEASAPRIKRRRPPR
jgi:hypothetical protein